MTQKQALPNTDSDVSTTQQQLQPSAADANKAVQPGVQPRYPQWPTSVRGPLSTPPPVGMKPINARRREQVAEIGYNQETGEPGVERAPEEIVAGPATADQAPTTPQTAQKALGRRKQRL
ncbi:MAG TPA: hypothetical protein VKR06_12130 [Ktedonosporobacter sp.]|nr:hypothetical protein [Ktedonosporobacter sp.]